MSKKMFRIDRTLKDGTRHKWYYPYCFGSEKEAQRFIETRKPYGKPLYSGQLSIIAVDKHGLAK